MLPRSFPLRNLIEQLCDQTGFDPELAFKAENLPTIRAFVDSCLGLAAVPATQDGPVNVTQAAIR